MANEAIPSVTLTVRAGDVLKYRFQVRDQNPENPELPPVPRDLTGWTVLSQLRTLASSDAVVATWDIAPLDATGVVAMRVDGSVTQSWAALKQLVSDVQLTDPSGDPTTILDIVVLASQDVSREP